MVMKTKHERFFNFFHETIGNTIAAGEGKSKTVMSKFFVLF